MLRNRRDLPWPSVVGMGRLALAAGAGGLTVHPRPDERHIRYSDVPELRALIDDEFPDRLIEHSQKFLAQALRAPTETPE